MHRAKRGPSKPDYVELTLRSVDISGIYKRYYARYGDDFIRAQKTRNPEPSELSLDKYREYCTIDMIDESPEVTGSIIHQIFDLFFSTKGQNQSSG